jgi:hypothetical protein
MAEMVSGCKFRVASFFEIMQKAWDDWKLEAGGWIVFWLHVASSRLHSESTKVHGEIGSWKQEVGSLSGCKLQVAGNRFFLCCEKIAVALNADLLYRSSMNIVQAPKARNILAQSAGLGK